MTQEETKAKVDALLTKHYQETFSMRVATKLAILSLTKTIEALEAVLKHDKERYGIVSRGATIVISEHQAIKEILEKRLAK